MCAKRISVRIEKSVSKTPRHTATRLTEKEPHESLSPSARVRPISRIVATLGWRKPTLPSSTARSSSRRVPPRSPPLGLSAPLPLRRRPLLLRCQLWLTAPMRHLGRRSAAAAHASSALAGAAQSAASLPRCRAQPRHLAPASPGRPLREAPLAAEGPQWLRARAAACASSDRAEMGQNAVRITTTRPAPCEQFPWLPLWSRTTPR